MGEERLVVIDTDAGLDDTLALLISLRAHKEPSVPWRILGITCVNGNTTVDHVCMNVTRTLHTVGLLHEIPIFRGAEKPLVHRTGGRTSYFHGDDGLGDTKFPENDLQPKIRQEHAVHALIRLAQEFKGNLTVIAIGPLTNIALAINMDPNFSTSLKELCIMGGNIWGMGNIAATAEFNFWSDPESAHVVLHSEYKKEILLVPWETCKIEARFPLSWRTDVLAKVQTKEGNYLNRIEESSLKRNSSIHSGWMSCDSLVPAVMLNSKIVKGIQSHYCRIELAGNHTRGQVVIDHPRLAREPNNVLAVTKIELAEFGNMLLWAIHGKDEDKDFKVNNNFLSA